MLRPILAAFVASTFAFEARAVEDAIEFPAAPPTAAVQVLANDPASDVATWQDTGLMLQQGDTLFIDASGAALWHDQGQSDPNRPAGTGDLGPQPGSILLSEVSFMALVGKVGAELIAAGAQTPTHGPGYVGPQMQWTKTSPGEGRLYLAINDGQDSDNSGGYHARIWIVRDGSALDSSVQLPLGSPVPPVPAPEALEGERIFHGTYSHYARGQKFPGGGEVWVHRRDDGAIRAIARLDFFNETTYVETDAAFRPTEFALMRGALGQYPPFESRISFAENTAQQTNYTPGEIVDKATFRLTPGALFDYNARPDSYIMAHALLRRFKLREGNSAEWTMCDWGTNDDEGPGALVSYTVRVEYKGVEPVAVPAGRFDAHHVVVTQLSSADTFYKKREGHITEFWVLDNYVVARLVRHREPYELQLATADNAEALPGYLGEASIVPVFVQRHDHSQHTGAAEQPGHEHDH